MNQKQANHAHRIEQEAIAGIERLVASKLRNRGYGRNEEQAKILADCARETGVAIVEQLLKHYTIRERKARS